MRMLSRHLILFAPRFFYRIRGQHRHPRTQRMLRYYFAAQDIHERTNSTHFDYQQITEKLKKIQI